jgi:hypothetical protein
VSDEGKSFSDLTDCRHRCCWRRFMERNKALPKIEYNIPYAQMVEFVYMGGLCARF